MEKTAMEELLMDIFGDDIFESESVKLYLPFLKKEREQIEEAFKEGAKKRFNTMLIKRDEINKAAFDYFTQTYGKG